METALVGLLGGAVVMGLVLLPLWLLMRKGGQDIEKEIERWRDGK